MGAGALLEPAVVVFLLFGGAWWNRDREYAMFGGSSRRSSYHSDVEDRDGSQSPPLLHSPSRSGSSSPSLLPAQEPTLRQREVRFLGYSKETTTPNTRVFKDRLLSRLLRKFPFLVECWYWALIYWVYQLGRAASALLLVDGTVLTARRHALQVVHLEQRLHIFWEVPIQQALLQHPFLMHWTNRIYSYIHIPGSIAFLVGLFYYTTTRSNRIAERKRPAATELDDSPVGPALYEARRRTMALSNLLAFVVFTLWPCMPPRLLSDKDAEGVMGEEARTYGFVDTVHGAGGEKSMWTQNKFCNQYAAMPSLHFGYSLLIGLTILTMPLSPIHRRSTSFMGMRIPSKRRLMLLTAGTAYPLLILFAIISTANHFILDAVAGACVCGIAWFSNSILLNLLVVEDYFLWLVRIHKPEKRTRHQILFEGKEDDEVFHDANDYRWSEK